MSLAVFPSLVFSAWFFLFQPKASTTATSRIEEARQAFEKRDFEEAVRLFAAVPDGPDRCEALFYEGLSLQRLRRSHESIVALQSAAACSPTAGPQLALAEAWITKGDDNRAAAALEAVLKSEPRNADALRAISSLYLRHELNDKAVAALQTLVALTPEEAQAHADLGAAYAGAVRYEQAQAEFEQALKIMPEHTGALTGLANVLLKTDQAAEALALLDRAKQRDKGAYEVFFLRGMALHKLGRVEEAVTDFHKALSLGGEDPDILYQLSRAYRALGRDAESRKMLARFSAVRAKSQADGEAKRESARLLQEAAPLVEKGMLREAMALLQKACELDRANPSLLFRLAGLQYDLKNYEEARRSAARAIELVPSEWMYHYLLGLIDADTQQLEAARRSLETAAGLDPSRAEVQDTLGRLAMRRGDVAEAVRRFEKAAALNAQEPVYRRNLEAAKGLLQSR